MLRLVFVTIASVITTLAAPLTSTVDEPQTLMARIAEWQYPGSKINGASMSDVATINGKGERTVPSIQCRTVLTTTDPIAMVLDYYKTKLKPNPDAENAEPRDNSASNSGRSVTYHDDSDNRPLAIHMILVNTDQSSTTLVISRADTETETHIAWTQYSKLQPSR
jgi:hypothetical protein